MTTTRPEASPIDLLPEVRNDMTHQLRATWVVTRRELLRLKQDKARMVTMLLQPVLFIFVMGTGLGSIVDTGGELISINLDTARALNMTVPRHIPLRVFGTSGIDSDAFLLPGVDVVFDQIQFRNFGVAVLNLRAPSALLGFQVGGILGHRFLEGHTVTIDLERSELRLKKS